MNIDFKKLSQSGTGWDGKVSKKDYKYEEVFGATTEIIVPKDLGREKLLRESPLADRENLIYQLYTLGCVPLHITMKNMWNSLVEDNSIVKLSWTILYALAQFFKGAGTSVNNVLSIAKNIGQCLDKTFSQDLMFKNGGDNWIHNPKLITEEMKKEAENWKIGDYTRLEKTDINSIREALLHGPVLIGVRLNEKWNDKIIYSPGTDMNHLTLALESTNDGNIKIWEGFDKDKLDIRVLHKDSYIGAAYSFRDIPDKIKFELKLRNKSMFRLIKGDEKPEVYFLETSERGYKHHVRRNMNDLYDFAGVKDDAVEILPQATVDEIPSGVPFDMKMLQFWNVAQLYLRRDVLDAEEKAKLGESLKAMSEELN